MAYSIARIQVLKNRTPQECIIYPIQEEHMAIPIESLHIQGYEIISTFTGNETTYVILKDI